MVINLNVQYNGGFLPDILLFTQGCYHWGTHLNAIKRFTDYNIGTFFVFLTISPFYIPGIIINLINHVLKCFCFVFYLVSLHGD